MSSSSNIFNLARFGIVLLVIGIVLGAPIMKCFVGFYSNYSDGFRQGEIVKASTKGIVFVTNELQLQIGTSGENLHSFSCPDEELWAKVQNVASIGGKVRIDYRQWLIMPYSVGSSEGGYEVTGVEVLEPSLTVR